MAGLSPAHLLIIMLVALMWSDREAARGGRRIGRSLREFQKPPPDYRHGDRTMPERWRPAKHPSRCSPPTGPSYYAAGPAYPRRAPAPVNYPVMAPSSAPVNYPVMGTVQAAPVNYPVMGHLQAAPVNTRSWAPSRPRRLRPLRSFRRRPLRTPPSSNPSPECRLRVTARGRPHLHLARSTTRAETRSRPGRFTETGRRGCRAKEPME